MATKMPIRIKTVPTAYLTRKAIFALPQRMKNKEVKKKRLAVQPLGSSPARQGAYAGKGTCQRTTTP